MKEKNSRPTFEEEDKRDFDLLCIIDETFSQ